MGAQEVVVSNKQGSKRDCAIRAIKPVRRFYVVFISSVKTLNELFEGSEFLGLFIEVLKSNDLMMLDIRTISRDGVDEVDAGWISGIAIGNKDDLLIRLSSTDRLLHSDYSRKSFSVVSYMVSSDFKTFTGDKEEDVIMLAMDFNVGFSACAY